MVPAILHIDGDSLRVIEDFPGRLAALNTDDGQVCQQLKLFSVYYPLNSMLYLFLIILGAFACSRPKLLKNFRSRTHGRGEETHLCSECTFFNSLVRAERLFAIHYLKVVIKR